MRNASISGLHDRPKFSSMRRKSERMKNVFHAAIVVGAIALPLVAMVPNSAHANTLKEVTSKGIVLTAQGLDIDVVYTPDGKFSALEGMVTGSWRIDGDKLCVTSNAQPEETCNVYPPDKKSGDTFELATDQGAVTIRIK